MPKGAGRARTWLGVCRVRAGGKMGGCVWDSFGYRLAMLSRFVALIVGVLALAALRGQFDALLEPVASQAVAQKLWFMAGYFTILTNLAVAAVMLAVAGGWKISGSVAAGLLVSIVMVGLIYHLILARLWQPQGLAWWANQALHTAVPLAFCGWWLAFADKEVGWADLPKWLIWPAVYGIYVVVRGMLTGYWPYPFVNVETLGAARVAVNTLGLMVWFAVLGAGVIGVARLVRRGVLVE